MLILLDRDGLEVGSLPYTEMPDNVLLDDGRTFEFEGMDGDDFIFREVES